MRGLKLQAHSKIITYKEPKNKQSNYKKNQNKSDQSIKVFIIKIEDSEK